MAMNHKPNIDILLATYNGQKYLAEQIDSILSQSYQDWQLLIRDDESCDDTPSIIRDYTAKYPSKIKLIEDNSGHLGVSSNFQRLLEKSTSEYIMFSDQDDVWLPSKIEATLNLMKVTEKEYPNKPILVHTDLKVVDSQLRTIAESTWQYQGTSPETGNDLHKVIFQNVATGCTIMINREAKASSLPIPKEAVMHDWWIIINVAKHGKVVYIPDQLVLYRQHSNNVVGANKATGTRGNIWSFLKNLPSLKKRLLNHYRMLKRHDPNVTFLSVVLEKIANKIAQRFR